MYNVELAKTDKIRFVAIGSSCSVSIQDITVGNPAGTELKYYSAVGSTWSDTPTTIPMVASPTDAGICFYTFDAAVISPNAYSQEYLVITRNGAGDMLDAMILRVGTAAQVALDRIGLAIAPARRELSRLTDTRIRISSFADVAGTKEKLRIQVDQDITGNQPEEIQTDVSGTII